MSLLGKQILTLCVERRGLLIITRHEAGRLAHASSATLRAVEFYARAIGVWVV